ncbi:hypothetical protein PFICI_07688 [Pestalotiopsis fici W106-1]|uniref:Major facilitator superfamily (MFS) profile domain-containing protein n=1 Tax=Pestalotiopsis fici (strain W106-1 / CGMCC3.15140) TaxID=1229662 RepID=W3X2A9_PESFW|nr:uncharacterized protein PFICI_07688 [Pestalotiopsis fici W106-1]ETS80159.1 hypothetical protein PFICI_07688 [Pestalotiopsis fici W106-1]
MFRNQDKPKAAADETTPLLASSSIAPTQDAEIADTLVAPPATLSDSTPGAEAEHHEKPLDKTQIVLLCYTRVVEPIAFFSIFPYINNMLQANSDLPASDVGFYSGLIESLFSLTQMSVMLLWGLASDRIGRKPVLVSSLVGVSISTGIFGLARNLWQMILFRCLAGVFAGTIVTIRTMISEHSSPKTQARSFAWFAFAGNLGILFGPLVGGALAEPATQYPGVFGNIAFFKEFPYALPSFAVGGIGLTAVITTALFVKETLKKQPSDGRADSAEGGASDSAKSSVTSTRQLLKSSSVPMALYIYGHVMLLAIVYTAVMPVFWFTPISLGGFGFTPFQISIFMGLTGFSQAVWLLVFFPPLQHRLGTNGVLRLCSVAYPFAMAANPLLSVILRSGAESVFWLLVPIFCLTAPGISMAFTAVQLCLNDVSPSPQLLGTLNALALTCTSGLRSFSPALITSLYAIGVRSQILWGYLAWLIIVFIAIGFTVAARFLPAASEKDYPDESTEGDVRETDNSAST